MQPRISIIVPCYNGSKYIRETLDCLQKQTIVDWECVVVNDGSTDNSLEILKEYAAKDSRYKYIDKENGGPSIARNIAIAASSGKYILPLDADDLIAPSYAEKAIEYLEMHPETKMVYCICGYIGERTGIWDAEDYDYDNLLFKNMLFNAGIFRKSDFDNTIGYNPNMRGGNEDWDFWLTLLNKDDKVYKIPEVLFYYRQHGISRSTEASEKNFFLKQTMVENHLEIYKPWLGQMIVWRNESINYRKELDEFLNSKKYKLVNLLCSFIGFFRR